MSREAGRVPTLRALAEAATAVTDRGSVHCTHMARRGNKLERMLFFPVDVLLPGSGGVAAPRRHWLQTILLPQEASPGHEDLMHRSLFAERYAGTLVTLCLADSGAADGSADGSAGGPPEAPGGLKAPLVGLVAHQNPAATAHHGCLIGLPSQPWIASLLGSAVDSTAAASARAALSVRAAAQLRVLSAGGRCFDVSLTPGLDPVTHQPALVVCETEVTDLARAEVAAAAAAVRERVLLRSRLPPSICERILLGETAIADTHDCVTILFADVARAPPRVGVSPTTR